MFRWANDDVHTLNRARELLAVGQSKYTILFGNGAAMARANSGALPGESLESELFGFGPGVFTGAIRSKPGKFEMADGGTILLDEVGEISFS